VTLWNRYWIRVLLCALCWMPSGTLGAPPPPPGMPGAPNPPAPPPPALNGTVLPDITFDNLPLPDVLNELQHKVPDFRSVIVTNPFFPVDPGTLILPKLSAKDLTLGQFMDFLQAAFPGLSVQAIDGPHTPLYVIHVQSLQQPSTSMPVSTVVKVYPLKDIVAEMAGPDNSAKAKKQALDDLMTLMVSVVNGFGDNQQYALNVHEPTMTMICRASPQAIAALDQTVTALEPKGEFVNLQSQLGTQMNLNIQAQHEMDAYKMRLEDKAKEMDELTRQLAEAKYRLEIDQTLHPAATRP
jgi:hypothetical protein